MTYEYHCPKCGNEFDVIKYAAEMERAEQCACGEEAVRQFVPSRLHLSGTKVQHAEYNPAFGQVVHNKRHRDELAKKHGVVEIGNDYKKPADVHKHFDQVREQRRKDRWAKL